MTPRFGHLAQILRGLLMSFLLVLPMAPLAQAQTDPAPAATTLPDQLTPESIRELVARMSDDQVRTLLLQRLDAVAAQQSSAVTEPATLFDRVAMLWTAFSSPIQIAFERLPVLFSRQGEAFAAFSASFGGGSGLLAMFGLIALVLAVGLAVEYVARQVLMRVRNVDPNANTDASLRDALMFLGRRFLREIFGLVVFYIVIRIVGRAILTPAQIQFAAPLITYLIWMPRLAAAFSRFTLAPNRADLRLVNASDSWAQFLHRNIIGLVFLGGLTLFAIDFNRMNGVLPGETRLGFWLDSGVYIYIMVIAWIAKDGLSEMMRGTDEAPTRFEEQVARLYPYFAICVAAAMWVVVNTLVGLGQMGQLVKGAHYSTMFWLLLAPALDTGIRGLVRHLVPPMSGGGQMATDAHNSTKRSYIRIGRVLVFGLVVMIISNVWDVNLLAKTGDAAGIGDNVIGFLMTLVVGYLVYEGVSLWINRQLAKEQTAAGGAEAESGGEGGGAGGSRLATVLPLLLATAQIGIVVIFGLLAVGALGIDITPLLAGAGILGLAIGFGAQKLVSDVVSGIFFLVDDAFRVGEYVEVDGTMGTVEKISIRSMQLRHHRGLVHTIPYGEIPKLTNFSRDWVIMKMMFTVPFDTDPNKVKKIFKRIGAEMMEDPLFKDDFLEPFKSQGVFQFDDVGIVMRGKFMAKPGTQFTIRKEIYNRVRREFAANGIEFARREVRVALPGLENGDSLSEADRNAIAAAAGEAARQQTDASQKPSADDR